MGRISKERREVEDRLLGGADFDGLSLAEIREWLDYYESLAIDKGAIPGRVYFDYDYYGYDGAFDIKIKFYRLEDDREYQSRIDLEEKEAARKREQRQKKEDRERREYERLKKKFGGK